MTNLIQDQELTGNFSQVATIFTRDNLDQVENIVPVRDMQGEILLALEGDDTELENQVVYASWCYSNHSESTHFLFFPNAKRGAVCCGGDSEWSDCDSIDDLEDRHFSRGTDKDRWSN